MMIKTPLARLGLAASLVAALACQISTARAQGTAFTYQGRLDISGATAEGPQDFTFTLYDAATGGNAVGAVVTANDLLVAEGLFNTKLDFGALAFNGAPRWLQIAVRPGASAGAYTPLTPRQPVTPTPYAIYAGSASAAGLIGALPASALSGAYGSAVTFNNAANAFAGNGSGLASLNASSLASGTVADARLSANVALRAGGNTFSGAQVFNGGNVGIGVANPAEKLTLSGNTLFTGDANRTISVAPQPDSTTEGASLTIQGGSAATSGPFARTGGKLVLQAGNGYNIDQLGKDGGDLVLRSGANWISGNDNGGDIVVETGGANNTFVERLRVIENGNVGIGTANPVEKLTLAGNTLFTGDANRTISVAPQPDTTTEGASLTIQSGSAATSGPFARTGGNLVLQAGNGFNENQPGKDGGDLVLRSGANWTNGNDNGGDIVVETGGARNSFVERMRVLENGNVGIGTANPTEKLTVDGNTLLTGAASRTISVAPQPDNNTEGASLTIQSGSASPTGIPFFARAGGDLILQAGNGYNSSVVGKDGGDLILRSGANWISAGDNGGDVVVETGGPNNTFVERMRVLENGKVVIGKDITCLAVNLTSDRNAKEQFKPVNPREMLARVACLPISEWQYKTQSDTRHIGPMAQDFHEAFSLGQDDKHISSVDADGVALAAIQGLNEILAEKDAELGRLKTENKSLADRLAAIERALGIENAPASPASPSRQ